MVVDLQALDSSDDFDFIGGRVCLDFSNLGNTPAEQPIESYRELLTWSRQAKTIDPETTRTLHALAESDAGAAESIVVRANRLRGALQAVFLAIARGEKPASGDLERINKEVANAMGRARIDYDRDGFHLNCCVPDGRLEQLLWPIVRSAVDVLTSDQVARVRACAGHTCDYLFVDATRNNSRQWCDTKVCGNRERVHRHRERKRATDTSRAG